MAASGRRKGAPASKTDQDSRSKKRARSDEFIDEDIPESEASVSSAPSSDGEASADEHADETADERRLRLAKAYLSSLQDLEERVEGGEDASGDDDAVGKQLERDALEEQGRFLREVAHSANTAVDSAQIKTVKGHNLPLTCVGVSPDESSIFTGSKDCCVIRYDAETGKRVWTHRGLRTSRKDRVKVTDAIGHTKAVLALSVSHDNRLLCTGGLDGIIRVYDARSNEHVGNLQGHRGPIQGLACRDGGIEMYSVSDDRTVKLWNLENLSYMETLFGHQDEIFGVSALRQDSCVTCGRDATTRLWRPTNDTQFVFRGSGASIDCISMMDEKTFVSGDQSGRISLWSTAKKKPIAHAVHADAVPTWITSVAALPFSDLVASGSHDGYIRLYQATTRGRGKKSSNALRAAGSIACEGFVNGLAFAKSGRFLAAAVGQEHRLGRWFPRITTTRNVLKIIPLELEERESSADEDEVGDRS